MCLARLGRHWPGPAPAELASSDVREALQGQHYKYKAAKCAIPHDDRGQSFPGGCVDQDRPGLIRQVIAEPVGQGNAGSDALHPVLSDHEIELLRLVARRTQ